MLTIHRSKGLEFPIVYCPYLWEPGWIPRRPAAGLLPRPGRRRRARRSTSGSTAPDFAAPPAPARSPSSAARTCGSPTSRSPARSTRRSCGGPARGTAATRALGRLLFARDADGNVAAGGRRARRPTPRRVARFEALAAEAPGLHQRRARRRSGCRRAWARPRRASRAELDAARFDRELDWRWRRTSYSDITAGAYEARVASEPEERGRRRRGAASRRRRPPAPDDDDEPALLRGVPSLLGRHAGRRRTSARSCTACSRRPTSPRPTSTPSCAARVAAVQARRRASTSATRRASSPGCAPRSRRRSGRCSAAAAARRRARRPARRARLRAAARRRRRRRPAALDARRDRRACCASTCPPATRSPATPSGSTTRRCARACAATSPAASTSSLRLPDGRFAVVDYKTNWLGAARRGADRLALPPGRARRRDAARALRAAGAALHRRAAPLPALAAARLRPRAPPRRRALPVPARDDRRRTRRVVDGTPCGVFAWRPPARSSWRSATCSTAEAAA